MPIAAYAFTISFALPVLIALGAMNGGAWLLGAPAYAWFVTTALDRFFGLNDANADPQTSEDELFWHRFVTWSWAPAQTLIIIGCFWAASLGHLTEREQVYLMIGLGIATGGIGINFAHELIHSKNALERRAGDLLLTSVAYGHFATEHIYNHHRYVATPKDPVTARYNEGFWAFFPRAVWGTLASAWRIDLDMLRRRGKSALSLANPWW